MRIDDMDADDLQELMRTANTQMVRIILKETETVASVEKVITLLIEPMKLEIATDA